MQQCLHPSDGVIKSGKRRAFSEGLFSLTLLLATVGGRAVSRQVGASNIDR